MVWSQKASIGGIWAAKLNGERAGYVKVTGKRIPGKRNK